MWRHIIESHSTSYIRCFARLTFHRILHISVFDYTDCPCFEVKDEEDLLSEKTVQLDGTKPVEVKDRINDYETCESEE